MDDAYRKDVKAEIVRLGGMKDTLLRMRNRIEAELLEVEGRIKACSKALDPGGEA